MGSITVGKYAGFCFGVKRAVEKVRSLTDARDGETLFYTTGELIHNPDIVAELRSKGVRPASEEELRRICSEKPDGVRRTVVIRAHGVPKELGDMLLGRAESDSLFSVEDCTCPYVKKIHRIVDENTDRDTLTAILGDEGHPEVRGICSYVKGEYVVGETAEELEEKIRLCNIDNRKIILVSQTTQKISEWRKCQKLFEKVCTKPIIFDTICSVTETRQNEAVLMSRNVDMMIVIGGKNSSNTNQLYRTAKCNLAETYLAENTTELPLDRLRPHMKVGITAGASTPSGIIEEVKHIMENLIDTVSAGEDFAGMLEQSLKTISTGETIKGTITGISSGEIHVDLGAKVTGIIPTTELGETTPAEIAEKYHVGDEIEAIVVKYSDVDGIATLSRKKIENIVNWRKIVAAYEAQEILEGKIESTVKGGVIINLFGLRVFIPASHTGVPKDGDLSSLVGTTQRVKIIEINDSRRRAVASIRVVVREERKKLEAAFWETIEEGKVYTGKVKSLTSYGAFVDLGGIDGMVHSSELSWTRIAHPSDVVSVGQEITVFVKSFDKDARRISLGYKTEETNPWNIFMSTYTIGDVAKVRIVSLLAFGAFAELVPGVDGLIHISQISTEKIASPADVLHVGDEVDVKIVDIDYDNHKISLSMRALLEPEADEADEGTEEYIADEAE